MISSVFNAVDRILITKYLSTGLVFLQKLFMLTNVDKSRLQTWLNSFQMVDSKQKNRLVHRNWQGLSTIAID
jgi:hypothetical protein